MTLKRKNDNMSITIINLKCIITTNRSETVRDYVHKEVKTMIDTVKFDIQLKLTEAQIEQVSWTEIKKTMRRKMVRCELFNTQDDTQPRIVYSYKEDDLNRAWLKVELSMPRFLHGSNVYELKQAEVEPTLRKLRRYVAKLLRIPLSQVPHFDMWEVEKLHICKNFNVGPHLQDYLKMLSTIQKPGGYKTIPYRAAESNRLESVVYQRKSRKNKRIYKFYDKCAEVGQKANYPGKNQHQKDAEGILRFEIELSYEEMRNQSPKRLAKELLNPKFAVKVLQEGLDSLGVTKPIKQSSLNQMIETINSQRLNVRKKNMLIAFLYELHMNGKSYCKQKYCHTTYYENYNQLKEILGMSEIHFSDVDLPPLKVHKDSFKNKKSRFSSEDAGKTTK